MQAQKIESKTFSVFAESEIDAVSKVTIPTGYKVQIVVNVRGNLYNVRTIRTEA